MVVQKQGNQLYDGVNNLIASNIDRLVDAEVKPTFPTTVMGDASQKSHESERFLKAVRFSWDDHIGGMTKLRDLLKYMVRISFMIRNDIHRNLGSSVCPSSWKATNMGFGDETLPRTYA